MSHWSETAQQSANSSMGAGAVGSPVLDCIDRSWEPVAEIDDLPLWEAMAEILDDPQAAAPAPAGGADSTR